MKTTIDIADELFARSRTAAQRDGTTLRALVEEGLLLALQARNQKTPKPAAFPTHNGGGMTQEYQNAGWEAKRAIIYDEPEAG